MGQIHGSGVGNWANTAQVTDNNEVKVLGTNYALEIARGNVDKHGATLKFGRNEDVDSGAPEDVWDAGGIYQFLSGAQQLGVTSSNSADAAAGVGARTLCISGLDENYVPQNETLTLTGSTTVWTAGSFLRTPRMVVLTAGASGQNIGSIVAAASGTGNTQAQVSVGFNQTLMAIYTIPSGLTGYVTSYYTSVDRGLTGASAAVIDVELRTRGSGGVFNIKNHLGLISLGTSYAKHGFDIPLKVASKSDILVRVNTSADNTSANAGFDIVEVDEDAN
jgi:hypothetical protein